jgi:hypothetical protein
VLEHRSRLGPVRAEECTWLKNRKQPTIQNAKDGVWSESNT